MRRRAAAVAQTRRRIVEATLELHARQGIAATRWDEIAARAGVGVGTVYRHFPSKSDLLAEVFRRAAERELGVVAAAAAADGRPALERIAAGVEAFARRALAGPVLAYALIAEPADPAVERERLRLRAGYRDVFAAALADGAAAGELAPHDSPALGAAVVGGLGEALVGPLARGRRRDDALVATLIDFAVNAAPRPSAHALPL